jgi:hypothetical protein
MSIFIEIEKKTTGGLTIINKIKKEEKLLFITAHRFQVL